MGLPLPKTPALPQGWATSRELITLVLGGGGLAIYVNSRAEKLVDRLDTRMDKRMDGLEKHMDGLDKRLSAKLDHLQEGVTFLLGRMNGPLPGQRGWQEDQLASSYADGERTSPHDR
mmetsp:Transcript_24930/g.67848  ORF Transcript_24930/g.67848 Transcript_24930/m.67848 type:complete len:117 (+) Transcript_24930:176-526(+)